MRKTFRRITAVALAGLMTTCIAVTASATTNKYECTSCKTITTSTLDVTSTNAVATTSINDGSRGVSVGIYGEFMNKDTGKISDTGNGSGGRAGVTTSIYNGGTIWTKVKSTHSRCCSGSTTVLNW